MVKLEIPILILQSILNHKKSQNSYHVIYLSDLQIAFNGYKNQLMSDIALDDISLTQGVCNESLYPEPTLVPTPPPELPSK